MEIKRKMSHLVFVCFSFLCLMSSKSAWAGTCNGASCEGVDPAGTTCVVDAKRYGSRPNGTTPLLDRFGKEWGYVTLIYSKSCNSNWAKVVSYFDRYAIAVGDVSITRKGSTIPIERNYDELLYYVNDNSTWTPMTDGNYQLTACGRVTNLVSGGASGSGCTPYF